ncbi:MAG: DsbA family oxidoreductase [Nocardiopsaceae bacterium]|nr:DsbA family oxidoreductase [Nocardiopsaceae bacterium]
MARVADRGRLEIVWRSYELDPAPKEGPAPTPTAAEMMAQWWGGEAPARIARIRELGAAEGLELNMHLSRPVNTFDAHRLCHLAADRGRAEQMLERLLRAYHTEGLNVADPRILERLGAEAGVDAAEVRALLAGDAYAESVRADERRAAEQGVTAVPSVVIDGRAPVPGVQPPAVLQRLLEDALAESRAVPRHA